MTPDEPTRTAAPAPSKLRRAGGLLVAVIIGLVAVVGLIVFFNSRDESQIDHSSDGAGPVPGVVVEGPQLGTTDRLLGLGDVVILYGGARRAPAALVELQDQLSGPPDPALTATGQAVLLEYDADVNGVEAHAWRRVLRTQDPADPQLEEFASYWLGRGEG